MLFDFLAITDSAMQTWGKRMLRHLPWYQDYDRLPADELYYMYKANASLTIRKHYDEN